MDRQATTPVVDAGAHGRPPATLGYSQASEGSTRASNLIVASAACLLLMACGGNDLESLGPPPEASPTGNVSPASPSPAATGATGATGHRRDRDAAPDVSPGFTGSVDAGNASLAVSGGHAHHGVRAPPHEPDDLLAAPRPVRARMGDGRGRVRARAARRSSAPTRRRRPSADVLDRLGRGRASFASDDGGCDVTVTTAEPTAFEGTFSCTGVTDEAGSIVVDATARSAPRSNRRTAAARRAPAPTSRGSGACRSSSSACCSRRSSGTGSASAWAPTSPSTCGGRGWALRRDSRSSASDRAVPRSSPS